MRGPSKPPFRAAAKGSWMTNSPSAAAGNVPALIGLLRRQRSLYEQLEVLSRQQEGLVAQGAAEPLLALLAQRQQLLEGISALHAELAPFRQQWTELAGRLPEEDRRQVNGLVEQVQAMLAGILERDERDRRTLQAARGRVAGELQRLQTTAAAAQAYRAAPRGGGASRFTDRQG